MIPIYLLAFLIAIMISAAVTPIVRRFALSHGIVDHPDGARKIHTKPIAYLGGVAIYVSFLASLAFWMHPTRQLTALIIGCSVLVVIGVIDDIRPMSAWTKLGWQFAAAMIALSGGIGITTVTNPFGGVIDLGWGRFSARIFSFQFHITPVANLISILWMVGLANTINFLDGLDGLACGVSGIAAFILFLLSAGPRVAQPEVALIAIILAGAAFGFLPYNFYPAKIFMGDSGAYFLGLTLAMLSIYSGAKLATAVLVLGFPIIDAVWAAVRRMAKGTSPFKADRLHFHHLLLSAGLSQRHAVLIAYALSFTFGASALLISPVAKIAAFFILSLVMACAIYYLTRAGKRRVREAS
jgi:UDP-GlcNAc:undecaprenyl-phosphate GlcNAc-1-phosphate transferase